MNGTNISKLNQFETYCYYGGYDSTDFSTITAVLMSAVFKNAKTDVARHSNIVHTHLRSIGIKEHA